MRASYARKLRSGNGRRFPTSSGEASGNIAPDPCKRRQWLTRQSCDRDYDTGKESTEAAENQNIVDFGHALPRKAPARDEPGPKVDEKEI
jgi:hypothetical protein